MVFFLRSLRMNITSVSLMGFVNHSIRHKSEGNEDGKGLDDLFEVKMIYEKARIVST